MIEHRLGRTLRVFLVVFTAAGFYRLTVVPLVEPTVRDVEATLDLSPEEAAAIRARADKRLAALGDIFPAGAWERADPIMLESRQMRLLFKEYHTLPDGRVNLVPCTLVVLPDRNRVAKEDTGRTLVLRAPQGAVLEFDEPLDLKQGRLAKLVGGSLRGQVTIRGTPSGSGAEDDIEIVTRDVELDELEVRTNQMVQFRYGRSSGSGRSLVARLRPRAGPSDQGPNIGGVDWIRLERDVRMRLEGMAGGLLPGRGPEPAADPAAPQVAAAPPPVLVSCAGSLCLNASANVITFEESVEVVRTLPDGTSDQVSCDLLAILLGRREQEAAAGTAGSRAGLEPVEIQAKGSPVVAKSSGSGLEVRAGRLGYEIATRRILLDGDEPVSLVARDGEMEARKIDYTPGPPGDPGRLMAVGPGSLRAVAEKSPPVQARWQQWLRMRPDGKGHVVSMAGAAEVVVENQGRLSGAELHLWLDMVPREATHKPPAAAGPDLSGVRPSRLLALNMVEADAEQVSVRTDRMEVWFRAVAAVAAAAGAAAPQAASPQTPVAAAGTAGAAALQPAQPAAPAQPGAATRGRMVATAGLVRGLVLMGPDGGQLDEMSMEGQVHLVEQPRPVAGQADLQPGVEIHGDQLQLTRAQTDAARAIVSGRPAKVHGRGIDLEGPLVEFDRGRNRLAVDGAGRLTIPVAAGSGGLEGFSVTGAARPPAAAAPDGPPGKLDVTWQGRLHFDGQVARFMDRVVATSSSTRMQSGSLDVVFNRPFEFGAGPRTGPQPDVARIACGSSVRIDMESAVADGSRSVERLFVKDLVIDRVSGDVSGTGPGRLTSTRLGQAGGLSLPAGPPGAGGVAAQPVAATRRPDEIQYLGVDFQRGLRGNIHRRVMEFQQRVEAINGPVSRWEETLDAHAATGLPAGAVSIASDVLTVGQSPPLPGQQRSTLELAAGGNVLVEGETFTARSARLTWSEVKDLLVFEGDGRSDAQLFRQLKAGAQPDSMASERILYWRGLNRVDVEGVRYLDLDKLPGGAAAPAVPGAGRPVPFAPPRVPGT